MIYDTYILHFSARNWWNKIRFDKIRYLLDRYVARAVLKILIIISVAKILARGITFGVGLLGVTGAKNFRRTPENFRKFSRNFLRKLRKSMILIYFSENITNNELSFRASGRKTQIVGKFWENFESFYWKFNRKIEFLIIFGNFVTQNRAFANTNIFSTTIFSVSGGGFQHSLPGYATVNY